MTRLVLLQLYHQETLSPACRHIVRGGQQNVANSRMYRSRCGSHLQLARSDIDGMVNPSLENVKLEGSDGGSLMSNGSAYSFGHGGQVWLIVQLADESI